MRADFVKAVDKVLARDTRATFITGDLGYNALESLKNKYGNRFLNAGVAEQNMIGVAAGIALSGFKPWVYSIANFATLRCLEQIRNDVCLHQLPVRIVGNGGGFTYGIMGTTHHSLEELAALKALPNMHLYFPVSNDQVDAVVSQIDASDLPSYLRLAVSPYVSKAPFIEENPTTLTRHYSHGTVATVIGVGHATQIALSAMARGILGNVDLFSIAKYPFNLDADATLSQSVRRTRRVIVVEEHYLPGGIAESLKVALPSCESFDVICPFYSPAQKYGSAEFHLKQCHMSDGDLAERIGQIINEVPLRVAA